VVSVTVEILDDWTSRRARLLVEQTVRPCHAGPMALAARYDELITVPRALRWPVELEPPPQFEARRVETWPRLVGRLEYVDGRLLFMPPCGDTQQDTVTDVVITLGSWVRAHPEFVLGTNEAGMHLGGETRAADAAVWRVSELPGYSGGFRLAPPVLAVEVAGRDGDAEAELAEKARWYLAHGVAIVWILLPETREVRVVTADHVLRLDRAATIPTHPSLPGLAPTVAELFTQLDRARR
jgi:Uma2 family endonuclease